MARILITTAILIGLAGPATAQSCEEGVALLDRLLEGTEATDDLVGPSRQGGEAGAQHPQFGAPADAATGTAAPPEVSERATVPPQEGNPASTGSEGPSGQPGQVAKEQPQYGAGGQADSDAGPTSRDVPDEQNSATFSPGSQEPVSEAPGPLTGGSIPAVELEEFMADLTSGERRRLVELRDEAVETAAAGREAQCLDALRRAEQVLTSPEQQN